MNGSFEVVDGANEEKNDEADGDNDDDDERSSLLSFSALSDG